MDQMEFAKRIKSLREEAGYTQKYVADELGIDKSTYAHYESGRRSPDLDKLKKLAELFGQKDELLGVTMPLEASVYYTKEELDTFEALLDECENNELSDCEQIRIMIDRLNDGYQVIENRRAEAFEVPHIPYDEIARYEGKTVKTIHLDVRAEKLAIRYNKVLRKLVSSIVNFHSENQEETL